MKCLSPLPKVTSKQAANLGFKRGSFASRAHAVVLRLSSHPTAAQGSRGSPPMELPLHGFEGVTPCHSDRGGQPPPYPLGKLVLSYKSPGSTRDLGGRCLYPHFSAPACLPLPAHVPSLWSYCPGPCPRRAAQGHLPCRQMTSGVSGLSRRRMTTLIRPMP